MAFAARRTARTWMGLIAATIGTAVLLASIPAAADAAKPRCMGKRATKVGTAGPNVIYGTKRADVIVARGGNDRIIARGGNDRICAGAGDDVLIGGPGSDRYNGGPDRIGGGARGDTASFAGAARGVAVSLKSGTAFGQGADRLWRIEDLVGTTRADTLTGSDARNDIDGGAGRDKIYGEGGNDVLLGHRQPARDTSGGEIRGGSGNDLIRGTDGPDGLFGDSGDDELFGFGGEDFLSGGDGNDSGDAGAPGFDEPVEGDLCMQDIEDETGCETFLV